ncbi:hypothetical protein CLCR_11051 [Cladophialophora carrionii]|uniref:Uncharacterized protein n=1 Tax=Cladophialophora carrionii TaxID=86049 RepID=A0A1C1CWX1_9EURO|nr:hypothetical protein CLCR_11051 [Cladophialophora carrionii]
MIAVELYDVEQWTMELCCLLFEGVGPSPVRPGLISAPPQRSVDDETRHEAATCAFSNIASQAGNFEKERQWWIRNDMARKQSAEPQLFVNFPSRANDLTTSTSPLC